jgi:hypothetical protein
MKANSRTTNFTVKVKKLFNLGIYSWGNGSYYKGQFSNGLRDGEGIWKSNIK